VLCDLAALGYDAQWGVVGAHHAGAPHKRDRIWIVANATSSNDKTGGDSAWRKEWTQVQFGRGCCDSHFSDPDCARRGEQRRPEPVGQKHAAAECGGWWESEPELGRVANGVAHRVDRLRCIGNGQVPRVAQLAWDVMSNQDEREKQ
jgi:DNA (cytosine-5)-methyltransferase 1